MAYTLLFRVEIEIPRRGDENIVSAKRIKPVSFGRNRDTPKRGRKLIIYTTTNKCIVTVEIEILRRGDENMFSPFLLTFLICVDIEIPRRGDENMLLNLSLIKSFPVEIEIPRRGDENLFCFLFYNDMIVEIEIPRRGDENHNVTSHRTFLCM